MWFKTIFRNNRRRGGPQAAGPEPQRRPQPAADAPLFDEAFLRRLERLGLQAQRTLRGNPSSGEHPSRHQLPASIFSDHRPYSRGDDLRYVDWNAYARQEHILVKLGEAEQDVNVHLLIDASRSMAVGSPPRLRLAQQLAGAIGYLALAHSDRLQLIPFGPAAMRPFGPAQGKAHLVELLRFIAAIRPQPETNLATVLEQHARRHPQGGLLVICSDLLDAQGLDAGLRLLVPPRWQVLVLHLIAPEEIAPTLQGPIELEDSETGQRLELTLDAETLETYRRRVADWRAGLARSCARRGATYAPILSTWPIEQKIVPYLRARRLLG